MGAPERGGGRGNEPEGRPQGGSRQKRWGHSRIRGGRGGGKPASARSGGNGHAATARHKAVADKKGERSDNRCPDRRESGLSRVASSARRARGAVPGGANPNGRAREPLGRGTDGREKPTLRDGRYKHQTDDGGRE